MPIAGPMLMHLAVLLLNGHRPVRRELVFVRVRPLSVLGPRWRSARYGEDEKSNCGSHVVPPLRSRARGARSNHTGRSSMSGASSRSAYGAERSPCDGRAGTTAVAFLRRTCL